MAGYRIDRITSDIKLAFIRAFAEYEGPEGKSAFKHC